jgi:N-acetylglucosaminyldiphosphoundecaprenol N-acetyl-beta-D-mannosaminyltransferase
MTSDDRCQKAKVSKLDNLSRDVHCVLGILVDNIGMRQAIDRIEAAVNAKMPLLLSTPNINFLVNAALDSSFLEATRASDLCVPDGKWLGLVGRTLGISIKERVAGADILESLKTKRTRANPIKVFFLGGLNSSGREACEAINRRADGLRCVGSLNPGYGSINEMSGEDTLFAVNSSQSDLLVIALGGKKGQLWLHRNHPYLTIPVRVHLGATINYYAGAIKRAPRLLQILGLEWAWRIKEEPFLWRRYALDSLLFALMIPHRIWPLALWSIYLRLRCGLIGEELRIDEAPSDGRRVISLAGALIGGNAGKIVSTLRRATCRCEGVILDLSGALAVDARFAGVLWMLQKTIEERGGELKIKGTPIFIRWLLSLYGFPIHRFAPTDI